MTYAPVDSPVPADCFVAYTVTVPAVNPEEVCGADTETVDITSVDDPFRQFLELGVAVKMPNGSVLRFAPGEFALALQGGGEFNVLAPNPEYNRPLTWEGYEDELAEEIAADFYEDDW